MNSNETVTIPAQALEQARAKLEKARGGLIEGMDYVDVQPDCININLKTKSIEDLKDYRAGLLEAIEAMDEMLAVTVTPKAD